MLGGTAFAQKVAFEEYNLSNGLHVILHNDPSAPVVITSVMYHVGAKDEKPEPIITTFITIIFFV